MAKRNEADVQAEALLQLQERISEKEKGSNLVLTLSFLLLIFGLLLLFILLPKKEYSKTDNATLKGPPAFSVEALLDGTFIKDSVDFLKDQFPFRSEFIEISSAYDLFMGNGGSGNILLGKEGYLLPKEHIGEMGNLLYTAEYCKEKKPVTVALAGNKSDVLSGSLPFGYPKDLPQKNRETVLKELQQKDIPYIDLASALQNLGKEGLYYKTDHHWTTLGAYYGSASILANYGKTLPALDTFEREIATENFKGTSYNQSGFYWMKGENLEFFRYKGDEEFTVTYCNALGKEVNTQKGFYRREALGEDYKGTAYDAFVQGVRNPIVKIEKSGENRPTLLVIKDSFAHSALPFLAMEYNIITMDIRSLNSTLLDSYLEGDMVDEVLLLCSTDTLLKK